MSLGNSQPWQPSQLPLQLPAQKDFPAFLSRTIFRITRATAAIRIRRTTMVPMFSLSHSSIEVLLSGLYLMLATALELSFVASLYFLKKSMYIIPTRKAIANIKPIMFTFPANSPPNW